MTFRLLQHVRIFGGRFFHQFGIHCATHQIRVILVSCVVITSLFYPALALYSSYNTTTQTPFSHRTLHVPFFGSDSSLAPGSAPLIADLHNLWTPHPELRVHGDAVTRPRCRTERSIRVERILIQSPVATNDDGALNHQILLSTLYLERQLEGLLFERDIPCIRVPDSHSPQSGKCLVLSPLAFWDYNEEALASDENILDTLSLYHNISLAGIPVTSHMVLAGRGSLEHHVRDADDFDYANHLVLTYFFPEMDCMGTIEHTAWLQAVKDAASQNAELNFHVQEPTLIALQYIPRESQLKLTRWSAISAFIYLAYTFFFSYVTWSMRRMRGVHSRIGLTFTALVEIAVSTITSLSVCALVGFKVTMVPWELLPIVIVFVGAENMFNLVDAVTKTHISLAVKQRIAEGLSRAGTSNTLKVVSYNTILGIIAVFSVGAIQQFCIFAIVVLVAHWFLAHTFFITVLSIDIQRLELDELLNSSVAPSLAIPGKEAPSTPQKLTKWQKLITPVKSALKGRARTNISLFLLLAITATLYYAMYPSSTRPASGVRQPHRANALARNRNLQSKLDSQYLIPALHIWQTLNPAQDPLLHLRIEGPAIATFRLDHAGEQDGLPRSDQASESKAHIQPPRLSIRSLRSVFWSLKIVVLPIAVTTTALYGLLLYLLKDAELLEAQRNRSEAESPKSQLEGASLDGKVLFATLPRAFKSDVELISASEDGRVIVSASLRDEVVVWQQSESGSFIAVPLDIPGDWSESGCSMAITSLALEPTSRYCAVGTAKGVIGIWELDNKGPGDHLTTKHISHLTVDGLSAGIRDIKFTRAVEADESLRLLATYAEGSVVEWRLSTPSRSTLAKHSCTGSVTESLLLQASNRRIVPVFCMDNGAVEVSVDPILPPILLQGGSPMDPVTMLDACELELDGGIRLVIGAATNAGIISLWDGLTGECIIVFDDTYGKITALRICPIACGRCRTCGEYPPEAFLVALSVDYTVRSLKVCISSTARRCTCYRSQPRSVTPWEHFGRRSRTNSTSSPIGNGSPRLPRSKLCPTIEAAPFPVSAHGVHSRKASEKDPGRRMSEILSVPPSLDDRDSSGIALPEGGRTSLNSPPSPSPFSWQGVFVIPVSEDVVCERGSWAVWNRKIVGLRRRSRMQVKVNSGVPMLLSTSTTFGIPPATLERWELWIFNPSTSVLHSSTLDTLSSTKPQKSEPQSGWDSGRDNTPRLPFTRVSPLTIASSCGLAGFGNTIGIFKFLANA